MLTSQANLFLHIQFVYIIAYYQNNLCLRCILIRNHEMCQRKYLIIPDMVIMYLTTATHSMTRLVLRSHDHLNLMIVGLLPWKDDLYQTGRIWFPKAICRPCILFASVLIFPNFIPKEVFPTSINSLMCMKALEIYFCFDNLIGFASKTLFNAPSAYPSHMCGK